MKANPDITENFYGKWWDVVDTEFPGYFDQDEDEGGNQCPDQSQTTSNQTLPQQATSGTQAGVATSNTNDVNVDKMLAEVQTSSKEENSKFKIKVNPNILLTQVDGELELSFREKVIHKINKNYQTVKVALAKRNIQ